MKICLIPSVIAVENFFHLFTEVAIKGTQENVHRVGT